MQVGKGQWNRVLDMVSRIRGLGMEVGSSLSMRSHFSHCSISLQQLHGYMVRGGSEESHPGQCSLKCLLSLT